MTSSKAAAASTLWVKTVSPRRGRSIERLVSNAMVFRPHQKLLDCLGSNIPTVGHHHERVGTFHHQVSIAQRQGRIVTPDVGESDKVALQRGAPNSERDQGFIHSDFGVTEPEERNMLESRMSQRRGHSKAAPHPGWAQEPRSRPRCHGFPASNQIPRCMWRKTKSLK